jgi:CHAP domain-containing protein
MAGFTEVSWAGDLLRRMGFPVTKNNMTAIVAWEYAEGGHFHNSAHFNPLNTTMDHAKYGVMAGGSAAGVASYPNYETGMRETIATLKLPAYHGIRHDLARSAAPSTTAAAVVASPWGTGSGVLATVPRARKTVENTWTAGPGGTVPHHPKHKPHHKHGSHGAKVVLDLHELSQLTRVYQNASQDILRHRKAVADMLAEIGPALAALADRNLAGAIQDTFGLLLEPGSGFEHDARRHDELSAYTGEIHRLAEQADSNHNGTWSRAEAVRFGYEHGGEKGAALQAVLAALEGGKIVRRTPHDAGGKPGDSKPKGGGGTQHPTGGRQQRIDRLLTFANKQHAVEHNGDNRTKYGAWFGNNGQVWCADFVSYVFWHSGNKLPPIQGPKGFAYVPYAINYARAHHQLHTTPQPGDIFLLKDGSHTGIVTKVFPNGTFDTVEGNHSNMVAHVHRNAHDGSYDFWRTIR